MFIFSSSMKDLREPVELECVSSVVQASQFCGNLLLFLAVDGNSYGKYHYMLLQIVTPSRSVILMLFLPLLLSNYLIHI